MRLVSFLLASIFLFHYEVQGNLYCYQGLYSDEKNGYTEGVMRLGAIGGFASCGITFFVDGCAIVLDRLATPSNFDDSKFSFMCDEDGCNYDVKHFFNLVDKNEKVWKECGSKFLTDSPENKYFPKRYDLTCSNGEKAPFCVFTFHHGNRFELSGCQIGYYGPSAYSVPSLNQCAGVGDINCVCFGYNKCDGYVSYWTKKARKSNPQSMISLAECNSYEDPNLPPNPYLLAESTTAVTTTTIVALETDEPSSTAKPTENPVESFQQQPVSGSQQNYSHGITMFALFAFAIYLLIGQ